MNNQIFFDIHAPHGDCYWVPKCRSPDYCCEECGTKHSRNMFNPDFYLKKNLEFADGWKKGPLYFVGSHAAAVLKAAKIDGLTLAPHFNR